RSPHSDRGRWTAPGRPRRQVQMSDEAAETMLEWKGRTGPFTVSLGRGVFHPTHTSRMIAEALGIEGGGAAREGGTHWWGEAIEGAKQTAVRLGLQREVEFRSGNLLDPVRGEQADVIIGDVSGIPDEIGRRRGGFPGTRARATSPA